ncbi:adherens junction-associated protein 1-like [Narcine bancroftii]|uniref:adherens junction-associated protein 1-like n=1 Tax=Narcine bancroftii TaxID=1343680 RepID=UPI0038313718
MLRVFTMLLKHLCPMPVSRFGRTAGCYAWMLLAVFHLVMDFSSCESQIQGQVLSHTSGSLQPVARHRTTSDPLWEYKSSRHSKMTKSWWYRMFWPETHPGRRILNKPTGIRKHKTLTDSLCTNCQSKQSPSHIQDPPVSLETRDSVKSISLKRARRQSDYFASDSFEKPKCTSYDSEGTVTVMPCAIEWGPTKEELTELNVLSTLASLSTTTLTLLSSVKTTTARTTTTPTASTTTTTMQSTTASLRSHTMVVPDPALFSTTEPSLRWELSSTARPSRIGETGDAPKVPMEPI